MRHLRTTFTAAVFLLCLACATSYAQTPFESAEGIDVAMAAARDSIGQDAELVTLLSAGADPVTGGPAFNIETGKSIFWAYAFYSPSSQKGYVHLLFQLVPGFFTGDGQVEDSVDPGTAAIIISANKQFSNSAQMAGRVRSNGDYQIFREDNGGIVVDIVQLVRGTGPLPGMPNDFPSDDELWLMVAHAENDTSKQLICFVATTDGQTYCLTEAALGVDDEVTADISSSMRVSPNPAVGRTRVTITAPRTGRDLHGLRLGLFDATGREVLDLTESFERTGHEHAEFDASALPAGTYFCRAVGAGFNGVIGTIVLNR